MSIAIPSGAAASDSTVAPAKEIARPLVWLLAILVLGLGLRLVHFRSATFEIDEFTTLAAVAERQGLDVGTTPTAQDPLVPVANLGEVSNRSVIPFGIQDPVPLYHWLLWAVVHVLPVAVWSVRLPSLLAGVACIAAVFFLVRRPFGNEMALVAALFVALDPIQVNTSWMARPFALADLVTVLSFAAVLGILRARTTATALPWLLGYAACVALIGYLHALMLFVVVAHLGMAVYALRGAADAEARKAVGFWAAGLVLGLLLLAAEFGYFFRVSSWAMAHTRYLTAAHDVHIFTPLVTLFKHNLALIGGLVLVKAALAIVRMQLQGGGEAEAEGTVPSADAPQGGEPPAPAPAQPAATAVAPAPATAAAPPEPAALLPENDEGLSMARLWVFLPQAALLLASLLVAAIFASRNMTYTTIGAAVLLAYYATRDGSREVRLGVSGAVALGLLLFGFWPTMSTGVGLFNSPQAQVVQGVMGTPHDKGGLAGTDMGKLWDERQKKVMTVATLVGLAQPEAPSWNALGSLAVAAATANVEKKEGDVVLMRPALVEADFLRSDIPEANRPQVERILVAPLTLLYPDSSHKPVIALTYSEYRNEKVKTSAGDKVDLAPFYDAAFAERLKKYDRYWMTGVAPSERPNTWQYLASIVPWMADHLDRGALVVARQRTDPAERYVTVKPGLGPDEPIKGLTEDRQRGDFDNPLHIVRRPNPSK